jgi:hypothetical protein
MMPPADPNANPGRGQPPDPGQPEKPADKSGTPARTVRVTLPPPPPPAAASGDAQIRIPSASPPAEAPVEAPAQSYRAAARAAAREAEAPAAEAPAAEEVGKPRLRALELKLDAPAPAPKPAPALRAPRSAQSIWTVRLASLFAIAVALGVLYWSVFLRLIPVTAEHRDQAQEMTRLADELETLRRRWSPDAIQEIKARHERAVSMLFDPSLDLNAWQAELAEHARMRVLEASLDLGPLQPLDGPAAGISSLIVDVNLSPNPAAQRRLAGERFAGGMAERRTEVALVGVGPRFGIFHARRCGRPALSAGQ